MQIRIQGTKHEVEAMREWLPLLFCVVAHVHVRKDRNGPLYRLYADVHPTGRPAR